MRAITYQKNTDTFSLTSLAIPSLETDFDVLIKVNAVALNPVDTKINFWHHMVEDMNDSFVAGLDVSGEIVKVGSSVTGWKVGDSVLYHGNMRRHHGGFAEYALQDSRTLIHHPATSCEIAAATPCAAWTAYSALVTKLNIASRKSILIIGGAGGVGSFAIQIAKAFGIETIIATSSKSNHNYIKSLGATHVIDYQSEDVIDEVMNITNMKGVEVALDCVGGENDIVAISALSFRGEMVELVKVVEPIKYQNAFFKELSFHQISLGSAHANGDYGRKLIVDVGKSVSHMLEVGEISVPKLQVITLEQVAQTLMEMRKQRTVGKIVAKV